MSLDGATDRDKLHTLCSLPYKEQAVWFLNANWDSFAEAEAENLWGFVEKLVKIDDDNKENGCALDELQAHRFLETFAETLTVLAMRAKLRESGAIGPEER